MTSFDVLLINTLLVSLDWWSGLEYLKRVKELITRIIISRKNIHKCIFIDTYIKI